ncbi:MAG TPA: 50S ribosomal protein L25 [Rhodothermales bacterium]|nr:50S ribosomal protein L25 [Rhodothermales bacterium]
MDAITLEAKRRDVGKKSARRIRRTGNVPCVLYGHRTEPVAFELPELSVKALIYTTETHVVNIKVDGKQWNCIMKSADLHPVTDRPIHADFQVLEKGEKITLMVPIQFHGTPVGQRDGGDTQIIIHEIEVRCLPQDIPSHIDVDISEMAIGDSIHIQDLDTQGIEILGREEQTIVTVLQPRVAEAEVTPAAAPAVAGEEEAEAGEESEESEE